MPNQRSEQVIPIEKFNLGGLADSKFSGIENSFYKLIGFDLHTTPGLLKVAQKLTKEAVGAVVDEFVKVAIASTNGRTYWFSSTSGKIWERDAAGTFVLAYTTTPAAGAALCLGAAEYQGYIYWATESRLHRILATDAEGAVEWAANAVEDWATFATTNASYHPMIEQNLVLYIGDGKDVAQVDAGVFSASALDIKDPLVVKCLGKIGTDILIGTEGNEFAKTEIFRWNTWSDSFTTSDTIEEDNINAFLPGDNLVFVSAGVAGNIYVYNGEALELYKKIPGDHTVSTECVIHPNAVANLAGEILFGLSTKTGDPADEGIYRLGRHSRNYPYILDLPYPISERSNGDFVLTGIEIGALLVVGQELFASWKHSAAYGVDKLDTSNKLDGAYLETMVMNAQREPFSDFSKFLVAYVDLAANTDVNISYSKNHAAYAALTEINDTARKIIYAEKSVKATTLQIKLVFTASSNDAPTIRGAAVFIR